MLASPDPSPSVVLYATAACVFAVLYGWFGPNNLRHIPTVGGPSLPILSFLGAWNYNKRCREIIQEGYEKYKGQIFKVALFDRWLLVLTGKKYIEELRKYPDDQVSFLYGTAEMLGLLYVFEKEVWEPPYHVTIIRSVLTQHLASMFGDIHDAAHDDRSYKGYLYHDEMESAFTDLVHVGEDEWTPLPAADIVRQLVARISGRAFIGLPYCRDPTYIDLAINLSAGFSKLHLLLAMSPSALKPFIARHFSGIKQRVEQAMQVLRASISERMKKIQSNGKGDYSDKPEDLLQWLTEEAVERGQSVETVVRTLLLAIFASTHTSANTFIHALYHVAACPSLLGPLREEVQQALNEEGWSKAGIAKMYKMDSLLKETLRVNNILTNSIPRKIMKPVTFSDGVRLPAGSLVVTPSIPTHFDEEHYDDPGIFNPWRFSDMRGDDSEAGVKQFAGTSPEYVAWGFGRHSCPGRFFAAMELKAMMAYIVMNYDVKFENECVRPENIHSILAVSPDPIAKILFRKRRL